MITVGSHWETGPWRQTPREIVIEGVLGAYDDEVAFRFLDTGVSSSTTASAFLRTYREVDS